MRVYLISTREEVEAGACNFLSVTMSSVDDAERKKELKMRFKE